MRYGKREAWFREMEKEGTVVKALLLKPSIVGEEWIWDAWGEMAGDRQTGMGPAPTPWSVVSSYSQRYGIIGDQFELFVHGIRALDHALIDYEDVERERREKAEAKKSKAAKKVKASKRR